jgi:small ligand-binding sensory domain FIST
MRKHGAMARYGDGLARSTGDLDLVEAAANAARDALVPLGGDVPDLGCVFVCGGTPEAAELALRRAREEAGARVTVGCTAGGVIGNGQGVESGAAVSVWAAVLPGVQLRPFALDVLRTADSLAVVGMPPRADDDALSVLLADPWSFPADGFVTRSGEALRGLPLVGGLAAGGNAAGSTRLLVDDRVHPRGAVGVVLAGAVAARTLVSQGCRPVGPPMTVTAAEGNTLLQLAGAPALGKVTDVLRALDGQDQALASAGLQLGIAMDEYADEHGRGDFLIRGLVKVDKAREAVLVGDVVEVGRTVRLHVRDAASAQEDLARGLAAVRADAGLPSVGGALLFTGSGRGTTLFPTADHDVTAVRQELGTRAVAGFFAAGEVGPVGGRNHVHGFTASMLLLGDESPR